MIELMQVKKNLNNLKNHNIYVHFGIKTHIFVEIL